MRNRYRYRQTAGAGGGGGGGGTGNLFNSGWEFATGTGLTAINDNGAWTDYGGGGQDVQSTVKFAGNNAIHVLMDGFTTNGPDFRIHKVFTSEPVVYIRWYQFFSSNYFFAQHDHKMVICGASDVDQAVYVQLRGNAGNTTARLCVQITDTGVDDGVDTAGVWECLSGAGSAVSRNAWHYFEARLQCGAGGGVQYRFNGAAQTMTATKNTETLSNLTLGFNAGTMTGVGMVKWDTTYNGFDEAGPQAAVPFDLYCDAFAVGNQDWIGA